MNNRISYSMMQNKRGKSYGWAAFDLKQREKGGVESELAGDPYPPISDMNSTCLNIVSSQLPEMKSFASVLQPALNFPPLIASSSERMRSNNSVKNLERNYASSLEWLKKIHNWATDDLIQDILAATNNDKEQTSSILRTMALANSEQEKTDFAGISSFLCDNQEKFVQREGSLSANTKTSDITLGKLKIVHSPSLPTEPGWEEDDLYMVHHRDAIRMMRVASQHSQAASNAYLRGDHFSAHQHSLKAQEEWKVAEQLNREAAKKILSIHNNGNYMWKLDLHGLHASEAVAALKEHLLRIESEIRMSAASYNETTKLVEQTEPSSGVVSVKVTNKDINAANRQPMSRLMQKVLHVVTGIGSHSHGGAALPTAVRSFLIENGYRFDDARAGVFAVRPKFRQG